MGMTFSGIILNSLSLGESGQGLKGLGLEEKGRVEFSSSDLNFQQRRGLGRPGSQVKILPAAGLGSFCLLWVSVH
jgi:hypothetical protein